jgi:hypothetical protein
MTARHKDVPASALELAEDVHRLELVLFLLAHINPLHTGLTNTQTQRDSCDRQVRTLTAMLRGWKATAQDKLRTQYLAP